MTLTLLSDSPGFEDHESSLLLYLLWKYQKAFAPDLPQTIPALAEDLAMSLDKTEDVDDARRVEICEAWEYRGEVN